ncbi:MAG: ABC transporter permease [Armatimonadetes bacterium]|nr:ABC transporter permease [Armatimonadota bacterium]
MTAWTIATNTVGEAMRKKVINIFLLVALIMIILSQAFAFFAAPTGISTQAGEVGGVTSASRVEMIVIKSMAFGVIVLAGLVMSIFLGTDLIPAEIERKTIYTILSKPVRRSAYITGKQLGLAMTLGLNFGLMGLAFLALIGLKTFSFPYEIAIGVLIIFVQFVMLGSVALLFSVFLTRNINAALTFFMFVVGMLSDFLLSIANQTGESVSRYFGWFLKAIHVMIPNFSNFNITNPLIHPQAMQEIPNFYRHVFLELIPYGLVYSAIMLLLAIFIFDRKEM